MNKIILDNKLFYYQVFFKKNKNMYMRIKGNIITITSPKSFQIAEIEMFIKKHKDFVIKRNDIQFKNLYSQEVFELWGETYNVFLSDGKALKLEESQVFLPKNFSDKQIEKYYIKATITYAQELIDNELKYLMKEINLTGLSLKSRLMKTRLGSCKKSTKNINLNSILARFNPKYLRVVLIHEIVHLKVGNHQKGFYNLLLKYEPKYKVIKKELNKIMKLYEI
ncbi:MAG: YgjP-like metallopeptidase domain-containing protein [Candidatus Izemoplasmatales bacterium]|nr:YgjP-like metallopeptidase domain-containing protein [Candidatus Izemoplasmatales bacterium]